MPTDLLPALAAWFHRTGLPLASEQLEPLGDGHSNPTFLIHLAGGGSAVLRRPPDGPLAPSTHDVLREAAWLRALGSTPVPVPRVLATCEDTAVIGVPFYVMELVEGFVPADGLPPELDAPDRRRDLAFAFIDALVGLHAADTSLAGLAAFRRPGSYLERQLGRFAELWERNRMRPMPEMDEITVWLRAHRPVGSDESVVHGDARPGNGVFRLVDGRIALVGLLDWEMAALGDPLADLGYFLATWAEHGDQDDPLLGVSAYTRAPGYPSRDELALRYAARSGRAIGDVAFYVILALWKAVVVMEGNYRRFRDGRVANPYFATYEAGLPLIAGRAHALAGLSDSARATTTTED